VVRDRRMGRSAVLGARVEQHGRAAQEYQPERKQYCDQASQDGSTHVGNVVHERTENRETPVAGPWSLLVARCLSPDVVFSVLQFSVQLAP